MSDSRTDLAVESAAPFRSNLPPGVQVEESFTEGVRITRVLIQTYAAARQLGRPVGRYSTLELPDLVGPVEPADQIARLLTREFSDLLPRRGPVLVVGLGNRQITPDALGPETIRQVLATRHLPQSLTRQTGLGQLRPVMALAPGVLGQTGIEAAELVRAAIREMHPAAVLAVDALAAQSFDRLGRTIQLSDTGISPGSGVLNARQELSLQSLGIPVISAGIPTVTDLKGPSGQTMMVTPRGIDQLLYRGAKYLSMAINCALQPHLSPEELHYLVS